MKEALGLLADKLEDQANTNNEIKQEIFILRNSQKLETTSKPAVKKDIDKTSNKSEVKVSHRIDDKANHRNHDKTSSRGFDKADSREGVKTKKTF